MIGNMSYFCSFTGGMTGGIFTPHIIKNRVAGVGATFFLTRIWFIVVIQCGIGSLKSRDVKEN